MNALKHFKVTVRVFDPATDGSNGCEYALPVDSPDEEHAVSFTTKTQGSSVLPVAFRCVRVERRL